MGGGLSNSWEIAFNPFSPGAPVRHSLPGSSGIEAIACPSTSQCTGIDDNDSEVTFNPASPGSPTEVQIDNAPLISSNGWGVQDISWPSETQCTGVDSQSSEVTFNPQAPGGLTPKVTPQSGAISCPSVNECVLVDGYGRVVLGTPSGGGGGGGSPKCVVPKVKGKTLSAAKTAIIKAHCTVGKIKKASSKHVKKGHVISQNPSAGRSMSSGSKVNLVVSKGRKLK